MDLLKLIKIMYAIEKESLKRWGRLVTYDRLYSLRHGQVVSQTYNMAEYRERPAKTTWGDYINTTKEDIVHLNLNQECGISQLSRAEIELIKEVYASNKDKTPGQLMDEHHNQDITPEWTDPGTSRIETKYSDLLRILGKTNEQITEFENELKCLKSLR